MKTTSIICLFILFQANVSLLPTNETGMKYTNKSYFAAIGITGEGKSSFLNVLSGTRKFKTSSNGNSETQTVQSVNFNFNGSSFVAIDTPGLDDSVDNAKKIKDLKKLIHEYPTLKCLLIVKKYNTFRLSLSLQEAIKVFMEAFPKENFWEHVIVINTFSNPHDQSFRNYFNKKKESFSSKIINCRNIREFMEKKGIKWPGKIKEHFIDTEYNRKNKKMIEIFNKIKNDIANHELMFKNVERSEPYTKVEKTLRDDTFIVKELRNITCTDFKNRQKIIIEVISEKEERLSELNRIKTDTEKQYLEPDVFRWYDYWTLTLSYWFRAKYYYQIDEYDYHKIGNVEIKYQKKPTEYVWN